MPTLIRILVLVINCYFSGNMHQAAELHFDEYHAEVPFLTGQTGFALFL